ncbi:MAG: phage protease [Dechloromonas sp.]|nr:phage protease [Dechloromonas sp.]
MRQNRHFRLSEKNPDGRRIRFLSSLPSSLSESLGGDAPTSWVTVTRTGKFFDRRYGEFEITRQMLSEMVKNFEAGTYGQDIFFDVSHEPDKGAAAKLLKLTIEGDRLRALVEWTPYGVKAVKERGFRYLSAEFHENWQDNEQRATHGCVLLGAGLTTRPVIKRLDPISLSEQPDDGAAAAILLHPTLLSELISEVRTTMKKHLEQLKAALAAKKLSEAAIASVLKAAEQAMTGMTDEAQMKALCDALEDGAVKLAESGQTPGNISISLGMSDAAVADLVAKKLADAQSDAKKLAETADSRRKLLADTVGEKVKDAEIVEQVCKPFAALVATLSEDAVKAVAVEVIALAEPLAAQKQLAAMGFGGFRGNAIISVDSSNQVKALQEAIDKRLGIAGMPARRRFELSGGIEVAEGKALAEKVLAEFDRRNGAQLHAEHKMLAGGDGIMSDVAVPTIFERTVIREVLYQMVGMSLVDVGTDAFAQSVSIPYSYRDTTAAGKNDTRTYEGQGVKRAGIKQAMDIAYPIPQKLAFEVSDELRYLMGNGQLNFDILGENARNAIRIIGEDTERLIWNEQVNAADEYGAVAVANEGLTGVNGANKIFVLAKFPVVKPRKIFDLQGNQVGNTINPVSCVFDGAACLEYDGTGTQANGTYFVLDYQLGEVRFVNQAGVLQTPANAKVITLSYSYASNAATWDTDLGGLKTKERYDDLLYRIGLRKALLEDQRSYPASQMLMSGTLMTAIEQAESFGANFARPGTTLDQNGNLGAVKGIPGFKSYAPGLQLGDNRIVIGQRGLTRFRMLKPWALGQLQDQKDSNGRFTGKKEAYGDQFIALHTPSPLKAGLTSIVLYSATGRVNRAS